MVIASMLFVIGLLMLYYGAEWLVKGASNIARNLGLTPMVIGLTVVAFGTSMPELVISAISSFQEKSMIAVGNVVGSNICNIALILGLASLFTPIKSNSSIVKRDIPVMLGIFLYFLLISFNSKIGRLEGATMIGGIIIYTWLNYYWAVKRTKHATSENNNTSELAGDKIEYIPSMVKQIALIVTGILFVVAGAQILIDSAVKIMHTLGLNEKFIGLTVVALGTSLPELATSVVAAIKKEMDISIGNLVGSNVFNILGVLGTASLIRPVLIPGGFIQSGLLIDCLVMMFISFLPWVMMRKTNALMRRDGIILLSCYVGYIAYLIVKTS
ncbi:MAG: calcium/sodium antiporter [Deltaproteobacteria bacterium]|nr:calcium/sodium antiporter [Deltaproteobacteria bacterium]